MSESKVIKLKPGESVTIVCEESQPQPTPTPEPTPEPQPVELGSYLYSVGLISDLHICKANGANVLVAGSAFYGAPDRPAFVKQIEA